MCHLNTFIITIKTEELIIVTIYISIIIENRRLRLVKY